MSSPEDYYSSASDSEDAEPALSCDLLFRTKLPQGSSALRGAPEDRQRKPGQASITTVAFCGVKKRFYYGLDTGDLCFMPMALEGTGTSRYVGSHKGPITAICIPCKEDGELGAAGLLVSGGKSTQAMEGVQNILGVRRICYAYDIAFHAQPCGWRNMIGWGLGDK